LVVTASSPTSSALAKAKENCKVKREVPESLINLFSFTNDTR